jgi:C4-dicarboxylate transporter, DctQ subunit
VSISRLANGLDRLVGWLISFCRVSVIVITTWVTAVLIFSVCARVIFNNSIAWVDETSSLLLVWLMLAVAPLGFRENFHISVDVLGEISPSWGRAATTVISNLAAIIFFSIVGYFGVVSTIKEAETPLFSLPIAFSWVSWVLPASSAIIVLVCISNLLNMVNDDNNQTQSPRSGI